MRPCFPIYVLTNSQLGPFGAITKNPILYISNTVDPATPIDNSIKWSPKYIGSQILTIEAVGHTSMAARNSCANAKIGKFFQTGELPGAGTVCKVEAGAFGVTTDVAAASFLLGGGNGSSTGNSSTPFGTGTQNGAKPMEMRSLTAWIATVMMGVLASL